ncbi:MAG: S-layer homology domain-containing protein [Clostridium sp.]|nr:S-layer homology domain-containing protein [Clostridium sp.]
MGKNFTKKLLPLALTAAMIVPSVPAMAAPSDIAGHWAESVITQWQSKGLIQGYEDGTFKPGNTITRAEFVTLMNNAKGFWSEGSINFSDVKNGSWFYSAVARAVAAGYVKGYSDGSFKPGNTITRAEAAVMIANAARLSANEAGAYRFTDVGSIPAWARGSVGAVVAAGYMTGYPDGSFYANASISRAEAVSSLNHMLGGTAYQPTQPTTPTTDTTKTTSDDVVIEDKGTTLKNQTVDGNVTIAKSVGNGDVTLRNVTIKGDLIVKGGGSNTVTLEDVDVRGKARLLKEGVHLHLVGDTDIRKLLIDLAAHITQSSSYKDEIGEIILAGDGDLSKTTRIDVPAKQLRIENQADLILGGDVEKLIVDEDAKGAEIEIKKGTTVNELNTDAKIKLTGKGRIDLLDVSASGVTFDKNLNIRKTDTSNGATAPKENGSTSTGGSSGGSSGTASKEITGAEKVTRDVPYGTSADDALAAIPKTVTLKLKGGSTTTTTVTNWKWADGVSYNATPTENTNYKATTTVTIPSGYTYNGTLTAEATVTVHPLDKTKLEAAKNAYMDLQNKQTYDEKEAATDKEKILIKDSTPDQITAGVRFATPKDWRPLDDAIKSVENQERIGFASQQKCDDTAKTLQAAIDDFIQNKVKVGTSKTTDAYILQQVKDELLKPDKGDYAYSSKLQPLKSGSAYPLYMGSWTADNGVYVDIQWTATGEGTQYVTKIEDSSASGNDTLGYYELNGIRNTVSRGALIGGTPDKPTEVTFTATVKNSMTQKEIGTIDYTALIGAPISVSANQPSTVPQFTVISDGTSSSTGATKFTGVVPITLNGAEAITDVSDGCVTMDAQSTLSDSSKVSFSHISVDKVEKSDTGLNVTVTVTTGAIGGVWDENSPYPFKEGILPNISIDTSKLQLKENTLGWYLPTDNTLKLKDMTVEVLTPAFTKVEYADDPTTGNPTFTIQTQNMPENAKVEVALEKKDVGAGGIDNATIKKDATRGDDGKYSVTFDKSEFESGAEYYLWFRYGSPGSDWAYESVTNRPTYTPNSTTGGGSDSSESGSGNTTEGSQAGA